MRVPLDPAVSGAPWVWKSINPMDQCKPGTRERARWQLLDLFSLSSLPFRAKLNWTAGDEGDMTLLLDVPRSTRVAVAAYDLRVMVANDASSANNVGCTLTETTGPFQSQNQWTERGVGNDGPQQVTIPRFAIGFRVDLDNPAVYGVTGLCAKDGYGDIRLNLNADAQPAWLPLGSVGSLLVQAPPGAKFRTTFILSV